MSHNSIEKRTMKYKHKNQSHQHSYFWTIIPRKTQCRKIGAADKGLYLLFFSNNLFTMNDFSEHRETSMKTPEIIFLLPLEKF